MSGGSKTRVRKQEYFKCENCLSEWEGKHMNWYKNTKKVLKRKKCKECKTMCEPYLRCSECLLRDCMCKEDKADERERDFNLRLERKLHKKSKFGDLQNRDHRELISQRSRSRSRSYDCDDYN